MEEILLDLEDDLWRANREGDGEFYATTLRDDALTISKYGVVDKATVVPVVQANRNPYVETKLSNHKVLHLTDDCALITYQADVTTASNVRLSVLATSVYVRGSYGDWRLVVHQQTPIAETSQR
jgi:hypothetical protein